MGVLAVDVDFQGTVRERSSRLLETAGGGLAWDREADFQSFNKAVWGRFSTESRPPAGAA